MERKCSRCGFKNPPDVGECLYCHRSLPTTIGQVKQVFKNIDDVAQGRWTQVGRRVGETIVTDQISSIKYRFHPVWFIKLKLHGLKKFFISFLWFLAIIIILVIIGVIYKTLGGK